MLTSLPLVQGLALVLVFGLLVFVRLLCVLPSRGSTSKTRKAFQPPGASASTAIVLGSGGHTAEMLKLLSALDCSKRYKPRFYWISNTDDHSVNKLERFERSNGLEENMRSVYLIPRSREVGQSFFTSFFTTLWSMAYTIPMVMLCKPDLILCNGPGTCIPVCAAGILLKMCFFRTKMIYVESLARVQSLSLSGKIMYHFADRFLVQWPQLEHKYPASEYIGRLI